ncbi:MAG: Wadjet anti-phage system protein JetD domain-containing protein [Acidiferrobacter sp.]
MKGSACGSQSPYARRRPLRTPDDIRRWLAQRFARQHRRWLTADGGHWPLVIDLGLPTEDAASHQPTGVRAWIAAWQQWPGPGTVVWRERRWRTLGVQRLPAQLVVATADELASLIGEKTRFTQAGRRYRRLIDRWPPLATVLPRHFPLLADASEDDFLRLEALLAWLSDHPHSGLYPRQLPIAALDSKWLEGHKRLVTDLMTALRGGDSPSDFYADCGLKAPPSLIRLRILDPHLRRHVGGLSDISAPIDDLARLNLPATCVFIIENLQTALAFPDGPGAVVLMGLGYAVEGLARLPWLARAPIYYWGDLDTHGLAILSRARAILPHLQSVLMDEDTLFAHRALWVTEPTPHGADQLPHLTPPEQAVYHGLKQQRWGHHVRLEQERIGWDYAERALSTLHPVLA